MIEFNLYYPSPEIKHPTYLSARHHGCVLFFIKFYSREKLRRDELMRILMVINLRRSTGEDINLEVERKFVLEL